MILKSFELRGKTALVTGCNKGIGFALAEGLAEAGADIIGVSRTIDTDSDIERSVKSFGRNFWSYQCDFSERKSLYQAISEIKANHSVVDILVNNAGTIMRAPAAEHSDEYWDKVIEVNQNSQFILTREFGKEMIARGSGKIIFTASF